jgi:hypothetical protein
MTLQEKIDADLPLSDEEHEQFLDAETDLAINALFSDPATSLFNVYGKEEILDAVDDMILSSEIIG